MKIIQNTLKIEEKFSDVPKKIRVGPKNSRVGRVSRNKTFFWPKCTMCFKGSWVSYGSNLIL